MIRIGTLLLVSFAVAGCDRQDAPPAEAGVQPLPGTGAVAYVDANIWDGTGSAVRTDDVLVVRDGRVEAIVKNVPEGAEIVSLRNRWIVPGLINAHGHVSGGWAGEDVTDAASRVRADLALYAHYGITTVLSLGGAPVEAIAVRNEEDGPALDHARLRVAGQAVAANTPDAARDIVRQNAELGVDWIKLRIDDNLGRTEKMPWDAIRAAILAAQSAGLPVATHIFYLEDAARALEAGSGLIAHSVRDQAVTDDFVAALGDSGVCYVPTLVREVSAFVYAERPDWFDDPFFLEAALPREIERLSQPDLMAQVAAGPAKDGYQQALVQAQENLRVLLDAGVPVAFGTDSGPAGRFPGYFEHLEVGLMAEAGLTPEEILLSATSVAAHCIGLDDLGTLEPGKRADFVVLADDPLEDIRSMRSIESVYVAGNEIGR